MTNIKLDTYETKEIQGVYTFKDLYDDMLEEMERYDKLGKLEGLMNSNVNVELLDKNGSILSGLMNFSAGYLIGEVYHVQGALDYVYEEGTKDEE